MSDAFLSIHTGLVNISFSKNNACRSPLHVVVGALRVRLGRSDEIGRHRLPLRASRDRVLHAGSIPAYNALKHVQEFLGVAQLVRAGVS